MKRLRRQRKERQPDPKFVITQYDADPHILEQCGRCAYAMISQQRFEHCPLKLAMRTQLIECAKKENQCWSEGLCLDFEEGVPIIKTEIPIAAT
ncbi:MAG: hypothetical protein HYT37_01400 [Candidatus Sungbacteria bacterium]|nr:hypothetical protein [Candidatus Sungbacteria bacterium]